MFWTQDWSDMSEVYLQRPPLWRSSKRARPPVAGIDPLKGLSWTRPILRAARTGGSAQFARGEECAALQPEIVPPTAPDSANLTARRAYLTCGSTFGTLGLAKTP